MPDFEVRKEAARILGILGDARALEELLYVPLSEAYSFTQIGSLPDRFSQQVINAASAAAVKIGAQHFDQLLALLRKRKVAPFAAKALGWVGDRRAVPHLVLALKGNDEVLSECAAEALGELKDTASIEALIDTLSRNKNVAVAAGKALQHITGHLELGWGQESEWRIWWERNRPT
jgi:HEAT repeat protein